MESNTSAGGYTLGVIDIGSNSGRVMVARVRDAAHLDVLGDARSPLRLVRDVADGGRLSTETMERTVRNLAKVDRRMRGDYPISRLHGFVVDRRRVDDVSSLLASAQANDRARVPGLNTDRSDSIVGGALVIQSVMDRLLAPDLTVAGY